MIRIIRQISRRLNIRNHYTVTAAPKSVVDNLKTRILATGPITVADYMREILINSASGYYMNRDVFGASGDFTTSPEISQIFGELLAVWFLHEWKKIGQPKPLHICEFGPGRGTLMDDILRVFSKHTDKMSESIVVHLVEISPMLSAMQEKKLCSSPSGTTFKDDIFRLNVTKYGAKVSWHQHLTSVPRGFCFYVAHEFFDALPVHQFRRTPNGWREVYVDLDENEKFRFVLSSAAAAREMLLIAKEDKRETVEISVEGGILVEDIASRLNEDGGAALVVDYGHYGDGEDTLRSYKHHQQQSVLEDPGSADVTADVDFAFLRKRVENEVVCFGPVSQRNFLTSMGINVRLEQLLRSCSADQRDSLISGYKMLTEPQQMGERFKFFSMFPLDMKDILTKAPPAGFCITDT